MINNIEEKLIVLKELIEYGEKNGLQKEFYEQVLKELLVINHSNLLINYTISENGLNAAVFKPKIQQISISVKKMKEWLDKNIDYLKDVYNINDSISTRIFLVLFVIDHEVEHSNQLLISKGAISTSNELMKNGYKGIFDLFNKEEYIIPRPIKETRRIIALMLYKIRQNLYILERNANVESSKLLAELAMYMQREDIFKMFNDFEISFSKLGYTKSNIGCLEETYRNILMYDKYKKFYENSNISEEEKIRYGLKIDEESRNKILALNSSLVK